MPINEDRFVKQCKETEARLVRQWKHEHDAFALNLFEFNTTLSARVAIGHGIDRETVASVLRTLADAILTQDCAESMSPVSDGNTLEEMSLDVPPAS
jgi:hypothetical protein